MDDNWLEELELPAQKPLTSLDILRRILGYPPEISPKSRWRLGMFKLVVGHEGVKVKTLAQYFYSAGLLEFDKTLIELSEWVEVKNGRVWLTERGKLV